MKPFPAAVEDAHAVLLWAKKNKAKLGWTGKRMLVAGIEAGANLAAVCALMARDRGGAGAGRPDPDHADAGPGPVHLLDARNADLRQQGQAWPTPAPPATAATCRMRPTARHPYASPLQSSRLKNLPPALILSAEDDPLRDEAEQYGAKLITSGVTTTVRRLAPAPLQDPDARNECACKGARAAGNRQLPCQPRRCAGTRRLTAQRLQRRKTQ